MDGGGAVYGLHGRGRAAGAAERRLTVRHAARDAHADRRRAARAPDRVRAAGHQPAVVRRRLRADEDGAGERTRSPASASRTGVTLAGTRRAVGLRRRRRGPCAAGLRRSARTRPVADDRSALPAERRSRSQLRSRRCGAVGRLRSSRGVRPARRATLSRGRSGHAQVARAGPRRERAAALTRVRAPRPLRAPGQPEQAARGTRRAAARHRCGLLAGRMDRAARRRRPLRIAASASVACSGCGASPPTTLCSTARGRIVLAGAGGRPVDATYDAAVVRLTARGRRDRTFPKATVKFGKLRGLRLAGSEARYVSLDDRGRILHRRRGLRRELHEPRRLRLQLPRCRPPAGLRHMLAGWTCCSVCCSASC